METKTGPGRRGSDGVGGASQEDTKQIKTKHIYKKKTETALPLLFPKLLFQCHWGHAMQVGGHRYVVGGHRYYSSKDATTSKRGFGRFLRQVKSEGSASLRVRR